MAHDYGLSEKIREYTTSENPIRVEKPYKQVLLVNVGDCKDRITVSYVEKCLDGIGWNEWEKLISHWLVESIVEAIDNGQEEADISKIFSCDLQGEDNWGPFYRGQEKVIPFLMGRLFECVQESDEMMRVRIIEKAICSQA